MKRSVLLPVAVLFGVLLLSSAVLAAPTPKNIKPASASYKQISKCVWYGEDIETKGLPLYGGIGAFASAYFYTCSPSYWYNQGHNAWAWGLATLDYWGPDNSLYSVGTLALGEILDMPLVVIASVGFPPGSG